MDYLSELHEAIIEAYTGIANGLTDGGDPTILLKVEVAPGLNGVGGISEFLATVSEKKYTTAAAAATAGRPTPTGGTVRRYSLCTPLSQFEHGAWSDFCGSQCHACALVCTPSYSCCW